MFTIVVTGGLGAGKSTALEFFRSHGASVIDLDTVGRAVLHPGSPTLERVAAEFGDDVVGDDGSLDRSKLAARAFATPADSARLNAIVHPAIASQIGPSLRDVQLLPNQPDVIVLEVPLLAEAPVYRELADLVVAITAPEEVRVERAVRKGLAEDDARRRIAAQARDEERERLADIVLCNDGDRDAFLAVLDGLWEDEVRARGHSA